MSRACACACACACAYACMCMRVHACVYVRTHVCLHVHIHVCACACMCVCVWIKGGNMIVVQSKTVCAMCPFQASSAYLSYKNKKARQNYTPRAVSAKIAAPGEIATCMKKVFLHILLVLNEGINYRLSLHFELHPVNQPANVYMFYAYFIQDN